MTDRTTDEMRQWMGRLYKDVSSQVISGPDPSGFRRVRTTNNSVTASGGNGFTQEGVDAIAAQWNGTIVQWNAGAYDMDATFTVGQQIEYNQSVIELGFDDTYRLREWYVTPAQMASIGASGGFVSGPFSTLDLRSALDD